MNLESVSIERFKILIHNKTLDANNPNPLILKTELEHEKAVRGAIPKKFLAKNEQITNAKNKPNVDDKLIANSIMTTNAIKSSPQRNLNRLMHIAPKVKLPIWKHKSSIITQ